MGAHVVPAENFGEYLKNGKKVILNVLITKGNLLKAVNVQKKYEYRYMQADMFNSQPLALLMLYVVSTILRCSKARPK